MRRVAVGLALIAASATARAEDAPICPDRPAKATGTCTVAAGRWQIETGLIDWLRNGDDSTALLLGGSTLKHGLTDRSDVELSFAPYVLLETKDDRFTGIGDVSVRLKQRVTADNAPVQVALVPFVKLPTARDGIGNGKAEAGLVTGIAVPLGDALTASFGPEVDVLADADGAGRHAQVVQLVNLAAAVSPRLTVAGELWGAWSFDPSGTIRQASVDLAIAYGAADNLAFDAGVNRGLTRATADLEFYAGVSRRF